MLDKLAGLFRRKENASPGVADGAPSGLVPAGAGASAASLADDAPSGVLQRTPVFARNQRIAGYQFRLAGELESRIAHARPAARRLHDQLLVRSLARVSRAQPAAGSGGAGDERGGQARDEARGEARDFGRTGQRLVFLDLAATSVAQPEVAALDAATTALLIEAAPGETVDASVAASLAAWAGRHGFALGWCWTEANRIPPFDQVPSHYLRIATGRFDGVELSALVRQARAAPHSGPSLRLIAADLATQEDFQHCFRLGFDLFQGPFVENRENWRAPASEVDRGRVMQILQALRGDGDGASIAVLLQQDPVLSYKFLRYINSAGMSLGATVHSLEQGLMVLGREKFYRWLSLLLFDFKDAGAMERSLTEQALVRARLMERLGSIVDPSARSADDLFLAGLFSLLDQIIGQSLAEVLARVQVSDSIRDALLNNAGPYATLLQLVIAAEAGNLALLSDTAAQLGLAEAELNGELLAALDWVQELTEALG